MLIYTYTIGIGARVNNNETKQLFSTKKTTTHQFKKIKDIDLYTRENDQ
ncbi:MAG: hypothetical protein KatS3mg090_0744 [Patescibacteria group bacterium]|nr:MAG: hypothetical protein KatS3mg090_0744 [Patescibacteria group bacterium]